MRVFELRQHPKYLDLFWRRVELDPVSRCWNWYGSFATGGYGQLSAKSYPWKVHRLSYWLHIGQFDDGLEIDHLCRNRRCVNPDHLEAVTHQVNMDRAFAARTHCNRGHEYTEESTRLVRRQRKDGSPSVRRDCRVCHRIYDAARYDRTTHRRVRRGVNA